MKDLRKKQRKASKYDIPQETTSELKRKYKTRKKKFINGTRHKGEKK